MTFESKKWTCQPWTIFLSRTILVLSRTKNNFSGQMDEALNNQFNENTSYLPLLGVEKSCLP